MISRMLSNKVYLTPSLLIVVLFSFTYLHFYYDALNVINGVLADDGHYWDENQYMKKYGDPPQKLSDTVFLNDRNFEHLTQASTGQTTGSWLVFFYSDNDKTKMDGKIPSQDEWREKYHTTVAAMNVLSTGPDSGRATFKRFKIKRLPSFLLIHKGKAYNLPKTTGSGYSWDDIVSFIINPNHKLAFDVPPPPTLWNMMKEEIGKDFKFVVLLFCGIFSILCFGVGILYYLLRDTVDTIDKRRKKSK